MSATIEQDQLREKQHYETLYARDGDCSFLDESGGYETLHGLTVSSLPPKSKVIDLGCGTGHHARRIAQLGHTVSGVDLAETAVEIASRRAEELGLPIDFRYGDIRSLPFDDREFDAAFLSLVVHHFPDYARVLREAARVSKQRIFVFEPNAWNPRNFVTLNVVNPTLKPSSPLKNSFRPRARASFAQPRRRNSTYHQYACVSSARLNSQSRPLGSKAVSQRTASTFSPNQRAIDPRRVRRILESCGFERTSQDYLSIRTRGSKPASTSLVSKAAKLLPRFVRHDKFLAIYERKK